jgi:hypothetical protein
MLRAMLLAYVMACNPEGRCEIVRREPATNLAGCMLIADAMAWEYSRSPRDEYPIVREAGCATRRG